MKNEKSVYSYYQERLRWTRTVQDGPGRTRMDPDGPGWTQTDPDGPGRTRTDPVGPRWSMRDSDGPNSCASHSDSLISLSYLMAAFSTNSFGLFF